MKLRANMEGRVSVCLSLFLGTCERKWLLYTYRRFCCICLFVFSSPNFETFSQGIPIISGIHTSWTNYRFKFSSKSCFKNSAWETVATFHTPPELNFHGSPEMVGTPSSVHLQTSKVSPPPFFQVNHVKHEGAEASWSYVICQKLFSGQRGKRKPQCELYSGRLTAGTSKSPI